MTAQHETIAKENRLNLELLEAQREIRRLHALLEATTRTCPVCGAHMQIDA